MSSDLEKIILDGKKWNELSKLHISSYIPPEKDISSKAYIISESGVFVKEKQRSNEKALWEFYMLYIWNQLFKKIRRKSAHIGININVPYPISLEIVDRNKARIYMEFIPGFPIKRYSEKSKKEIENTIIKINNYKFNLIETIAYSLGVICKIKKYFYLFHGDMDFRHIMFNYENLEDPTITIIDLEKAAFYDEIRGDIDRDLFTKAIKTEYYLCKGNLIEKFEHLVKVGKIVEAFEIGAETHITSLKKRDHYLENIRKKFFNLLPNLEGKIKVHYDCKEKIKQFSNYNIDK
ncbi:MAG: hypothetical protein QXO12_00100 [Candidatus Pacearchaeota archaeon]